ncbi:hypothetical protein VB732_33630, partial [Nostoc sp. UHCC 0252]|nr:hypothetical protein [Nostoc sp. UHCC 0252]
RESGDSSNAESPQRILDEALVVRGGRNRPEDIRRGMGTHPCGITGISVECALGLSVKELAVNIPHGQVGVTTVSEVRKIDRRRCNPNIRKKPTSCYLKWLNP